MLVEGACVESCIRISVGGLDDGLEGVLYCE